jgi:hypothetical protein
MKNETALQPSVLLSKEVEGVKRLQLIEIKDPETMKAVADTVIKVKAVRKQIVEYWKPIKEQADKTHKSIVAKEKEMLNVVDAIIKNGDARINNFLLEEKKRKEDEARREEEERQRKAAEEQKRLDAQLKRAVKAGNTDKAAEIMEKAQEVAVSTAPVNITPEKINTGTMRTDAGTLNVKEDIEIEIISPKDFFNWCAANGLFFLWEPKIAQAKKYIKDARLESVPGLKIKEKAQTTFRAVR